MTKSLSKKNRCYPVYFRNKFNSIVFNCLKPYIFLLIFSIYLVLNLSSCKEPDEIDLHQVTNQKLNVRYSDSTKIVAYSVREDSVITNSTTLNLLGKIDDPVFGKTTAGFYSQFRLPYTDLTFGTSPVLDSIVLTLAYDGYYGDISKQQTVNVYELTEDLNIDSSYYSVDKKNFNPVKIGTKTFVPKPNDSVKVDTIKYAPHLRINLDAAFANKFLTAQPSDIANNASFVNFFKGLYIAADSNTEGNSLLYFNPYSSLSQIRIYYHNNELPTTTFVYFYINTLCPRFNSFNHHGYKSASSDLIKQVFNKDTASGNNVLYLQSTGGVKTKIITGNLLRELKKLEVFDKDSINIAINKADLVIKPDIDLSGDTSVYKVPAKLALLRFTKDSKTLLPPDYYVGTSYFGGSYNKTKNEYRFSLSVYLQDLLNKVITGDKCLYLVIDGASANAQRIVLNGNNKLYPNNLRLEVTYTRLGKKTK